MLVSSGPSCSSVGAGTRTWVRWRCAHVHVPPRAARGVRAKAQEDGSASVRLALETLYNASAGEGEGSKEDTGDWRRGTSEEEVLPREDATLQAVLSSEGLEMLAELPVMAAGWVRFPGVPELLHLWEPCTVHMFEAILKGPRPWLFGHFVREATLQRAQEDEADIVDASSSMPRYEGDAADDAGTDDAVGSGEARGWRRTGVLVEITDVHRFSDGRMLVRTNAVCRLRSVESLREVPFPMAAVELMRDLEEESVAQSASERRSDESTAKSAIDASSSAESAIDASSAGEPAADASSSRTAPAASSSAPAEPTRPRGAASGADEAADVALAEQFARLQELECKVWSMYNNNRHMAGVLRRDRKAPRIPKRLEAVMPVGWLGADETEGLCDLTACTVDVSDAATDALRCLDLLQRLQPMTYRMALELPGMEGTLRRQSMLELDSVAARLERLYKDLCDRQQYLTARIAVKHAVDSD